MLPSFTDYVHGLRRIWWIPVLAVLVGLGIGLFSASGPRPTETQGHALFTFQIDDPGNDSAGSARGAEADVSQSRLAAYAQLARTSTRVREILAARGIEEPPTMFSETGEFKDSRARALIDISGTGILEVRVKNTDLSPADADELVTALTEEVASQALATDVKNVTPSLRPDPLVTQPQVIEAPVSLASKLTLPILLLAMLGLGLVYLIVWRQDRIYARRDIEVRVGARVLGDIVGRPADAHAIVLALTKGRESGTRVLILPVDGATATATTGLGEALTAAGRNLGLDVSLTAADRSLSPQPVAVGAAAGSTDAGRASGVELALVEATGGIDAHGLQAAVWVDIVAVAVAYGTTSYGELNAAGRTLAEVTDADVAVIGFRS